MNFPNKIGMNRTGKETSPLLSKAMLKGTQELTEPLIPKGDEQEIAKNRSSYMEEPSSLGSIPFPMTVKGVLKTGVQALEGNDPTVLLDKLGERLAFERTGVRLYDSLISKFKPYASELSQVVSLAKLEEFRADELRHFLMISDVIESLGADPTAVTLSADVIAMSATGIVQVLNEPRITFVQSLDAILTAELSDNDCWSLLIQLAEKNGITSMASDFREAYQTEQKHLGTIRNWVQRFQLGPFLGLKKTA